MPAEDTKGHAMSEYTCPKCGEEVGMMGHGPSSPCSGKLSLEATELGRLRVKLDQAERKITELTLNGGPPKPEISMADVTHKMCPFCHSGFFQPTGTAGRLACSACGSIALDGRKKVAVKIGEEEGSPDAAK